MIVRLLDQIADVDAAERRGDTALHIAARLSGYKGITEEDQISCVKTLLSHPGIDINLRNGRGRTAMMGARYESLSVFKQVLKTCNDFPADSYGKVVLCGHSGAGKSTLTQAIINISKPTAIRFIKRAIGHEDVVEPLTAGIIPHQVDSPYSNMIIYDLAGHHQYFSSHSACLEAIFLDSPAIFLLLQDLRKDPDVITKELYYWCTMINGVCHKCPQQSAVIVVGTHVDLLTSEQLSKKMSYLGSVTKKAIRHQKLVHVIAINLTKIYSGAMNLFRDLLYRTNKDVLKKGLIVFIPFEHPRSSWVVLHKESILKRVNGALFADQSLKEYVPLASNTGIITTAIIKSTFPEYNVDMITRFMTHFELCQAVDLSRIITNMAPDGSTSSDLGPLLFIPALVSIDRPSSAIVPNNSFSWSAIVKCTDQFFTTRFHHVLLHRLPLEFALPPAQTTPLNSHLSRRCDLWSRGIKWISETGVTTIVEMSESFQSFSLFMFLPDKADPNYLKLTHAVLEVIKNTHQDFCPHLEVVEVISCPPEASSDHSGGTNVELSLLKKAILEGNKHVIDTSGHKHASMEEWMKIEPCLPYLAGVSSKVSRSSPLLIKPMGQVIPQFEESSGHQPLSEMIDQMVAHLEGTPSMPELLSFSGEKLNISVLVGAKYAKLGIFVMEDKTGAIVEALVVEHVKNAERITMAILQQWLGGMGLKPVTCNMIIYDLAGQPQFFSSHSACLEAISLNSPAIFLLLQDMRKDYVTMATEVRYWSTMIDNVCYKCPQKYLIIVVGTHADQLKSKPLVIKKENDLGAVFKLAASHQMLVAVITLNLTDIYSAKMDDLQALLYSKTKEVLNTDQDKFINPDIATVVPLLKTLSEKVRKNLTGFVSTTGIISMAVLKKAFCDYNCDLITQFMVHFEIGQKVDLSKIKTNLAPEGLTNLDLCPLLFIPALVSIVRPNSATVPNNSFCWSEIVKSRDEFFTPRFHHVLLHRLPLEFAQPAAQTTSLHSQPLNRFCDVWSRGIKWLNETGVTTIVEMSESFQAISLTMSSPNKASSKYLGLAHSVLEVIKKTRQEFCPYLEVLEVVSCPPECSSDHSIDTRVELSRL
ncbi:hypothetical protein EMCRGX_G006578 [Ephydatia muelleri]